MKLLNKIKWILGISLVFYIVLTTNLVDRDNYNRIKNSIENIYNDRLIAFDLIYKMSNQLNGQKDLFNNKNDSLIDIDTQNYIKNIELNLNLYTETYLTHDEEAIFNSLKDNFNKYKQIISKKDEINTNNKELIIIINNMKRNLDDLAAIQIKEGKVQVHKSQEAMNMIDLFTNVEIIIMIILGIGIQFIILYKPKNK
jgi:hypothetical protein